LYISTHSSWEHGRPLGLAVEIGLGLPFLPVWRSNNLKPASSRTITLLPSCGNVDPEFFQPGWFPCGLSAKRMTQAGVGIGLAAVKLCAIAAYIEDSPWWATMAEEIFGLHRERWPRDRRGRQIDLDVFLLFLGLFLGFFSSSFLSSWRLSFLPSCPYRRPCPVGAGCAFLGYGDFVAFGREGILGVFAQGQGVEGISAVVA